MTEVAQRYLDYVDSLREWRGAQDARGDEIMRRLDSLDAKYENLDSRLDTLFVRIISVVATVVGVGVTLSQIL